MALLYPPSLSDDVPASERAVHYALRQLDDGWRVIHGVAWQSIRDGREGDGEADFVLVHPDVGLLVLEVKGGSIHIDGGVWHSTGASGTHRIRNPFEQATASQHALVRYLRDVHTPLPWLSAGHAVVFPDLETVDRLGPSAPPAITITRADLRSPRAAIERVASHWGLSAALSDHVGTITALLAPTVTARRLFRDDIADVSARLMALTNEQVTVLDGLRRNRRVMIYGGAGTGKTVLAIERARRLAADGFSVLLTCFNRPLADHLASQLSGIPQVTAHNFHSLCRRQVGLAGMDFPQNQPAEWWDESAPTLLMDACAVTGFVVDALVIDEGQDFNPAMFLALQSLLSDPDHGPCYVFADTHQAIYRLGWEPPFESTTFDLTTNCRNTLPISRAVASVYGDAEPQSEASGTEPEFIVVESPEAIPRRIGRVLHRAVNEGALQPDQVVVLTQSRRRAESLRRTTVAGLRLDEPGGGDVPVETIHRFKGLEADMAIVVLDDLEDDRARALAYIGMSRARAHLVVVVPDGVREQLQVPAS